ncbi:MAG: SRPBCC family protein [Myxococcota bacterium]
MLTWLFTTAFAAAPLPGPDTPLPEIDPDNKLRIAHHEVIIEVPVDELYAWWRQATLAELAVETEVIPKVERTEFLRGDVWQGQGTRRRVFLEDGSVATEEILADEGPARFRYQVFGYTSSAARFVEYGVGEFNLTPEGAEATRVQWTYKFRPQTMVGKLFLGGWVRRNWSPWMEGYLDNMKTGAEAAIRASQGQASR